MRFKKILSGLAISFLLISNVATASGLGGGISSPNFWKKAGNAIFLNNSSYTLGDLTHRIAAFAGTLTASSARLDEGASCDSTVGVSGYGILCVDTDKGLYFINEDSVATNLTTGAGSPADAQYVTLALNGSLSAERVLTGTANQIVLTDAGANGNITLSTPQNLHTAAIPQFARLGLGEAADANIITAITQAAAGAALRINTTSTAYTTATGSIQSVRSGALLGVDTEYVTDLLIAPTFALTEPATGTFTYRGANIDISGMSVTAGDGTSSLSALRLAANADADAGTQWALMVASGRSQFNDHITFGTGVAVNAADYMIGRDATATNILTLGVPTGASAQVSVNGTPAIAIDATTLALSSTRLTFTNNIATASTVKNIHGVAAAIRYNVPTGSRHDFAVNGAIVGQITGASQFFGGTATTSGNTTAFTVTTPANTGQTASTEEIAVNLNTSATVEFATGALALQRNVAVQAPTYAFVGASTISDASSFDITGAPTAGTNATITRSWGLTVGRDTDTKVALGRWALTSVVASDWATFSHYDAATSGSYALAQNTGGQTLVNAANGSTINMRINNADQLIVGAATRFVVNSGFYFGSTVTTADTALFGANTQTNDNTFMIALGTGTRTMLILEGGDTAVDFAHAVQANPTTFWHASDATDITKWGSAAHDGANFVLATGKGSIIGKSVTATITASTTQTQGNGALTSNYNEVSIVANPNDTVTLPAAAAGIEITIFNNGAQTLQIFPASGDDLGAGANTATTLAAGSNVTYGAYNATNWEVL